MNTDLTTSSLFAACPELFVPAAYQVIDTKTQAVVGTFSSKQAARSKRDRLDAAYGAVRYVVRAA